MDADTQALLALLGDDSRALLTDMTKALARIEARQALAVPPGDVRAGMAASDAHIATVELFASTTDAQLTAIVAWMQTRMSGDMLQFSFDDIEFVTKQLISIMQGSRDDLLLLRADVRRLAALTEQALQARVSDEEERAG